MERIVTFDNNGNIIEIREVPSIFPDETQTDVQAIAEALAALPQEQLDAIKLALGIS